MRVLIADEEAVHLFLLEMFLRKWGYEVVSTDSGAEAWRILCGENSPHIAILDSHLPGMDGLEICQALRRSQRALGSEEPEPPPYTYILLLSARAQEADIQKGTAAGADDHLAKPYSPADLQKRLLAARKAIKSAARIPQFQRSVPSRKAVVRRPVSPPVTDLR